MSNSENKKITAPNFTQIPNIVFDYWQSKLKPTEFSVLICLCRKIFGWHKTSDTISANQLSKMTGISKPTVILALKNLEQYNLVKKTQSQDEFGSLPNEYELSISIPTDEIYTDLSLGELKKRSNGVKILPPPSKDSLLPLVKKFNPGVVKNLYPQKKDLTKERLNKERESTLTDFSFSEDLISKEITIKDNFVSSIDSKIQNQIQESQTNFSPLQPKNDPYLQHNMYYQEVLVNKSPENDTKFCKKVTNDSNNQLKTSNSYSPPDLTPVKRRFNIFLTDDQHNKILEKFGPELIDKAYDIVSDRKLTKDYSKTSDFHLLQRTWVSDAIEEQELKAQEIKIRKEKLKKGSGNSLSESNRHKIEEFVSERHNLLRSKSINMIVGNKKVKINNDEIDYDNPKFNELIQHSLKKVGL